MHRTAPVMFAALAACSALSGCATSPPPAEPDRAALEAVHEAVYRERLEIMIANGGILPAYEPLEPAEGAASHKPLPAKRGTVSQDALAAARAYAEASGAHAFMVWERDALVMEAYFGGTTRDTPLVSKSLSKPLSAIVVGRAIMRGDIRSLDQPLADFIPEWRGTGKEAILVRHVLDMRSGLLEQGYSSDPDSPWNRAYLSPEHGDYLIDHYPMTHPPGTRFAYSNATSDLVAVLIERATGMRYGEFLSQEVLEPLGAMGGTIWVNREGGLAHSGCCMYFPAETWLRLGVLLLHDGVVDGRRLLPPGYVDAMGTGTRENPHHGLGLWIGEPYALRRGFTGAGGPGPQVLHSEPYLDPELVLFDGNANQVVYVSPNTGLVALRLGPRPPAEPEWDNAAIPNLLIRGLPDQAASSVLAPGGNALALAPIQAGAAASERR